MNNLTGLFPDKIAAQTAEIDPRFERVIADAINYCQACDTSSLISYLVEEKGFPDIRDSVVDERDSTPTFQHAYDISMISLALMRRPDFAKTLPTENKEHVLHLINKACNAVAGAIHSHDQTIKKMEGDRVSPSASPLFFRCGYTHEDRFNRMILFSAVPEHYGPTAAPQPYLKGIETMAAFWGHLLDRGSDAMADILFSRWTHGGEKEAFELELHQLAAATTTDPVYTEEQINRFKEELVSILLKTAGTEVAMRYHPDHVLVEAGANSDIFVGMTTFPTDTRTIYTDFPKEPRAPSEPRVEITNGRSGTPYIIAIGEESKPSPGESARQTITKRLQGSSQTKPALTGD